MVTLPVGSHIVGNGFFVVSNYANTSSSSTLAIVPQLVTTDVSLANTALQITLYDATHAVIDSADDGSGNPLSGALDSTKKMYASMERNPIPGDGKLATSWHSASRSIGFKSDAVERGTPGVANSNGLPAAEAGPNQSGVVGQSMNFDGSDSSDPESQPLVAQWDFGDGVTAEGLVPSHIYTAPATYRVTLTVSDGTDTATDSLEMVVSAAPPVASPVVAAPPSTVGVEPSTTSCRGLHFSELLPNPVGVDTNEFIELINNSDEDVPLGGCSVWTSTTRSYKFSTETTVLRGQTYVLPKSISKLTLNNGGTTVRLIDVTGDELDRVTYSTAPEGQSWNVIGAQWNWSTVTTPGKANRLVKPTIKTTTNTRTVAATTAKATTVTEVSLRAVQDLDSGDRVIVKGKVISPRDVLGATLMTIQSDDGGVVVSVPNGAPTVTLGQMITVTGMVRLKQGRRYVAADGKSIQLGASDGSAQPLKISTDDVGAEQADQLVHVKGVVGLASGNSMEIDDGSGPVSVYIKSSTGIVRPKVKAGDTVDVVGIVSVTTSGARVLPRFTNDVHVERVLGATTSATTPTYIAPTATARQTLWYWLFVAMGGIIVSLRPAWRWWQKKKTTS